ncbi:polysaccharide deacetylase family protein [Paenibacillus harenae]|uniref:polysaccharide deacetylase family protein n=1 Tax=Paenibacillus harenae TaxID=306543 RepID=UPI00040945C9|nr:polysaccharide deacetylase family protein [Paenibacillus harenae]
MLKMVFTVDVEDWFCSPQLPLSDWEGKELRLEQPIRQILELLDGNEATGTFFVLGWIAERKPDLIKEIHRRGHEIASHGYAHRLVSDQSPKQFQHDIRTSKAILEHIIGEKVYGYRAPCFSMVDWGLDLLAEEGFVYDSSLMPSSSNALYSKFREATQAGQSSFKITERLWEIPLPVCRMGGIAVPWGGGGYFRLYPYPVFQAGARRILKNNGSFVFYIHPSDLDGGQPRIFNTSWLNGFRRYYGLRKSSAKIKHLLSDYTCVSIHHSYPHLRGCH